MRVLPKVVGIDQQVFAHSLLESGVKLIAASRVNRHGVGAKDILIQAADPRRAGQKKIFVERGLESSGVRDSKHRTSLLDVVCDAQAGLNAAVGDEAVVDIFAQPEIEREV